MKAFLYNLRLNFWACLIFLWAAIGVVSPVSGEYPEKHIRVIVHVPPGAGTDAMARLVLRYAGKKLGTSFIIENYKGAGGQVGYTVLARSKPDGYTMGTITTTSILTHELTRKKVAYRSHESFIPIAQVVMDPSGLFVRQKSRFKTLEDLLEYAKEHPCMVNCGGSSLWGAHHVHCKLLERTSGAKLNYIPFDGAAEARNNLLGGHIDVAAGGISEYKSLIDAGKVRALVAASEKHMADFPDVPTYKEFGYDLVVGANRGFAVPAGTPPERVEILSRTISEVIKDPAFLKDAEKLGMKSTLAYLGTDEFKAELLELSKTMKELVEQNQKDKQ